MHTVLIIFLWYLLLMLCFITDKKATKQLKTNTNNDCKIQYGLDVQGGIQILGYNQYLQTILGQNVHFV